MFKKKHLSDQILLSLFVKEDENANLLISLKFALQLFFPKRVSKEKGTLQKEGEGILS